ncbi:MAG: hypothetical protein HZB14_05045 [Actinobacteria bacterium]|nr:hypothetical protein [Actinomycetota bacterium]
MTFGSDVNARTANSAATCGDFNIFQYAGRVGCSVYTTGNISNPMDTSATHVIPFPDPRVYGNQTGTITQVTFKTAPGAPAGPARLSVVEYIRDAYSTANPALAQDIADSATFTMAPGADGLVHVATNLPARSLFNASDNSYRYDVLVLSMLDNSTPIPADMNSQFLSGWISPYVDIPSTNGELTVPLPADRQGTGCCGFGPNPFYAIGSWYAQGEVLMQADLTIDGKDDDGTGGPVTFGKPRVKGNKVILPLTCALDTTCAGLLQLLRNTGAAANQAQIGVAAKKSSIYGRARFSIAARGTKSVKIKLTTAGKKRLRKRKSVKMRVKATVGGQTSTGTITVKRK